MKNLLFVGDSIRTGYGKTVKRTLDSFSNVYFPAGNCRFATYTSIQSKKTIATEVVKKYRFAVNGLYALSRALPEEAHSDAVYYDTPIGAEAFTNQVLYMVAPLLNVDQKLTYKKELYTDEPVSI